AQLIASTRRGYIASELHAILDERLEGVARDLNGLIAMSHSASVSARERVLRQMNYRAPSTEHVAALTQSQRSSSSAESVIALTAPRIVGSGRGANLLEWSGGRRSPLAIFAGSTAPTLSMTTGIW